MTPHRIGRSAHRETGAVAETGTAPTGGPGPAAGEPAGLPAGDPPGPRPGAPAVLPTGDPAGPAAADPAQPAGPAAGAVAGDSAGPAAGSAAPAGDPAPPAARRGRGVRGTVADMVRSLGILIVGVAVVWFVSGMWHASTTAHPRIADWRSAVTAAAPGAGFALLAPAALPVGWSVSALQLTGTGAAGDWTMTVTTAAGHYVDLDQVPGGLGARADAVPDGVPAGVVGIGTATWQRYRLPADAQGVARAGLGRAVGAMGVFLSGTGTPGELAALAATLQPYR